MFLRLFMLWCFSSCLFFNFLVLLSFKVLPFVLVFVRSFDAPCLMFRWISGSMHHVPGFFPVSSCICCLLHGVLCPCAYTPSLFWHSFAFPCFIIRWCCNFPHYVLNTDFHSVASHIFLFLKRLKYRIQALLLTVMASQGGVWTQLHVENKT